jgi:CRP-like cAMP-binding protein
VASADSRIAAVPEARFIRIVQLNPVFALEMMRILAQRVRHNLSI